jgi:hypothetical protein
VETIHENIKDNVSSFLHFSWECKEVQLLWKRIWGSSKYQTYRNPFLGMYPKEFKAGSQRGISPFLFTEALFTIANPNVL